MNKKKTWNNEKLAFEVWKYFGVICGADKDRMIHIVTWLLGFSAAIIRFYASDELSNKLGTILLIICGIFISILAAYIALLYGSYSVRNWSIADKIAQNYKWKELRPEYNPFGQDKNWFTLSLVNPSGHKIDPVFWFFFSISIGSLIIHIILMGEVLRVLL